MSTYKYVKKNGKVLCYNTCETLSIKKLVSSVIMNATKQFNQKGTY